MRLRITKSTVERLEAHEKDRLYWDPIVPGFGLKVTPAGGKIYVFQYRIGGRGNSTRRYTIGKHGRPWTADRARKEALRLLGQVSEGHDPARERKSESKNLRINDLASRFLEEHVKVKSKKRTIEEYDRFLQSFVLPAIGRRGVREVGREEVASLHHSMRGTPYQANRVLAVCSKMFNLAEKWNFRPDGSNPCRHVEKFPEKKRERFLTSNEIGLLGEALEEAEQQETVSIFVATAVRLLVLTGARLNEILSLQWESVDLERKALHLLDSKTGPKTIHLSPPAVEVLERVPRVEGNPYVIVGERSARHLVNIQKSWRRLCARAGLDGLRLHDLRHSFASVAAGRGVSLPVLGALLGHSQPATTARYAHLAADPLRDANDQIGSQIAAALGKRPPGGDPRQFNRKEERATVRGLKARVEQQAPGSRRSRLV